MSLEKWAHLEISPPCGHVCGAAGVGKSRVAREALATIASPRCEIRWPVATSSARELSLGAFASRVGSTAATDNLQFVRGVIDSLTSAAPGTTVILGVDDVHLLDDLCAFILHQIVQRRAAKVVLTVRVTISRIGYKQVKTDVAQEQPPRAETPS